MMQGVLDHFLAAESDRVFWTIFSPPRATYT